MGLQGLAGGDAESYLIQVPPFPWAKGHLPILLKSVSFPQLLLHLGLLMREILLPPRAEVDMPPPEPPDQRLRIPIIMCPQLAVLARVYFCLSHGFNVLIGLKIRKYSFAMANRCKTVKRLRPAQNRRGCMDGYYSSRYPSVSASSTSSQL